MGERTGDLDPLDGIGNRCRFRRSDEDRKRATDSGLLLKQEHRRVRLEVNPDRPELHPHHTSMVQVAEPDSLVAQRPRSRSTAAVIIAMRSARPASAIASTEAAARTRASGLRWCSNGAMSCS